MKTDPPSSAPDRLKRHGEATEAHLHRVLSNQSTAPPRLVESIRYSLMAGGKRLRPALVFESFAACQSRAQSSGGLASFETAHDNKSALASAAAMELIHTFSLVHDDLPAMDDDDLRRGRPTNHKVFGEAMAILAGDAMMTMAFELLATDADPHLAPKLIQELAKSAGPAGMIGGQAIDMDHQDRPLALNDLQNLHRMKTGALLTCSCRLGAIAANADDAKLQAVTNFGRHLGLAFQIVDDLLDVTSTPQQLGKATNKDSSKGKNTYPILLGIDASKAEAEKQLAAAIDAIKPLGPASDGLHELARFIVERNR